MAHFDFEYLLRSRWPPEVLSQYLMTHHPEMVEELGRVCPGCGMNGVDDVGGEVVCSHCGLVVEERRAFSYDLPFDTTYALNARVVKGQSLGGTLPMGDLTKVLTEKPFNAEKVGLTRKDMEFIRQVIDRANQGEHVTMQDAQAVVRRYLRKIELTHVKTHLRQVEPQKSMKLKEEMTKLLSQYGLYSYKEYNELQHQLADAAGVMCERVGRFLEAGWTRPLSSYRKMAAAILLWVMKGTPHLKRVCDEIMEKEQPDKYDLGAISCLSKCPLLASTSWKPFTKEEENPKEKPQKPLKSAAGHQEVLYE